MEKSLLFLLYRTLPLTPEVFFAALGCILIFVLIEEIKETRKKNNRR